MKFKHGIKFNHNIVIIRGSLRSKRFQSSYCAKVRAEAKKRYTAVLSQIDTFGPGTMCLSQRHVHLFESRLKGVEKRNGQLYLSDLEVSVKRDLTVSYDGTPTYRL